jgi:hypothetical protein
VFLTVESSTADSPDQMNEALAVQGIFQEGFARCEGLELLGVQVTPEDEFSLKDVQSCVRWDHSDHISYRETAAASVVPEAQ